MEFGDHQEAAHLQGGDGERIESMVPSYDSMNSNSAFTRLSKLPLSPVALDVEPTSQRKPRYRECLKNHAVNIGAQAVDGCGEFMPAGPDGTIDALKCAACTCHRNFHRKETYPTVIHGGSAGGGGGGGGVISLDPYQIHLQNVNPTHPHPQPLLTHYPHPFPPPAYYGRSMASSATASPTGYLQAAGGVVGGSGCGSGAPPGMQQRPLALPASSGGGGSGGGGGGEEGGMTSGGEGSNSKKRFRTKFTSVQKQRMVEFADKLNWRLQRSDDEEVHRFCNEMGLKRHVLKVWMHNNKHTIGMGKQQEEVKKEE